VLETTDCAGRGHYLSHEMRCHLDSDCI